LYGHRSRKLIQRLRLVNKIGQIAYGPLTLTSGLLLAKGYWQLAVIPFGWFVGIVASQIIYGRCVLLEKISALKKTLPKKDKAEIYYSSLYNRYQGVVQRLNTTTHHIEILNPNEVESLKKADVRDLQTVPRQVRRRHQRG
jgi:hypothetical protein